MARVWSAHTAEASQEATWVERAQQRDPAACRHLIRAHQRQVGAVLRRMLQPAGLDHLTEDLAQEGFLRAFRALPRFDPSGPARFSTWLLRIVTRLAINELQRRRPKIVSLPNAESALPVSEGAERTLGRKALAEAIVSAVAELPAEHRAAFILREYEGLEYAEIAEILEIELGTVKSRLHRARSMLRRSLAEVIDG